MTAILLHVGDETPVGLRVTVDLSASEINGGDIVSAEFRVLTPDYVERVWEGSLSLPTANSIRVSHLFDSDDLDLNGQWKVYVHLDFGTGVLRTETLTVPVLEKYQ